MQYKRLLVTGGAGFIGSAFIRYGLAHIPYLEKVVNLDLLTYASSRAALAELEREARYSLVGGNILNGPLIEQILREHAIDAIVHFAAESHVDRSIDEPLSFYQTNVGGTLALLDVVRRFPKVHFHHVSTDEVFGSTLEGSFTETSPYQPNSPYAASKAGSDHFVRAYAHTYGLSTTLSHCTNNYGPYQHPEKFIPRMIRGCFEKTSLPLYGSGLNVRDWIYVDDHVEAIWKILESGRRGEAYNIGANAPWTNLALLRKIIELVAEVQGERPALYEPLIAFVTDRLGHDFRYALDSSKIKRELGWQPRTEFTTALLKTIQHYYDSTEKSHLCHSRTP